MLLAVFSFAIVALLKFVRETSAERTADPLTKDLAVVARARERAQPRAPPHSPGASNDPVGRKRAEPYMRPAPAEWSLALLQSIEWKRFEEVVAAYFRANNFRCETLESGPDGGVDGRLYFGDRPTPVGIVQCKAWGDRQVGVAPVRELRGVMAHEKVERGYFCATGGFSKDAIAFAASNPIKLITGRDLLDAIGQMPAEIRQHLFAVSTTGDYTTPVVRVQARRAHKRQGGVGMSKLPAVPGSDLSQECPGRGTSLGSITLQPVRPTERPSTSIPALPPWS